MNFRHLLSCDTIEINVMETFSPHDIYQNKDWGQLNYHLHYKMLDIPPTQSSVLTLECLAVVKDKIWRLLLF